MKSKLCIFLIILYITNLFVFNVNAVSEETGAALSTEAAGFMEAFGFSDENTDYGSRCTRAKAAMIAIKICGYSVDEPKGFEAAFSDVSSENKYYPYIVLACRLGIMNADEKLYFYPDDYISLPQACRMFTVITGYTIISDAYQSTANGLGILKNVDISKEITVGTIYAMAYNTLHICRVDMTYGDNTEYKSSKKSVLEFYHNISFNSGIVKESEYTSLQKAFDAKKENYIKIDSEEYRYSANDYLGMHVRFYYDNYAEKLVYCAPDGKNDILKIDAFDITKYENNKLIFDENGKEKKASVPKNIDIIYNGTAYPLCSEKEFVPSLGDVTLIDNDTDGTYDVAVINSYRPIVVKSVNAKTQTIYDNHGKAAVSAGEDGYLDVIDGKKPGNIGNIEKDSVILAAECKTKNLDCIKAVIINDMAKGRITKISEDGFSLGDRTVDMYENYSFKETLRVGDSVSIYLYGGRGAAVVRRDENELIFSYMISAAEKNETDGTVSIKCISGDGDYTVFDLDPKVKINDIVYSGSNVILTALKNASALSKQAAQFPYAQPILYQTADNGKVKTLRILTNSTDRTEEYLVSAGSRATVYHRCNYTFYNGDGKLVCSTDKGTKVLYVPVEERDDYAAYELNTADSLEDRTDYVIEPISLSDERIPEILLVYRDYKASVNTWDMPCIVTAKTKMLGSDGVEYDAVKLIDDGIEKTFCISEHCVVPEFEKGDMVAYKINAKSMIIALEKRLDIHNIPSVDSRTSYTKIDGGYSEIEAQSRTAIGTVYNVGQTIIAHVNNFPEEGMFELKGYNHYIIGGRTKYFSFNRSTGRVAAESLNSLVAYKDDGANATKAVMVTKYGELRCVYIIK